ncbi:MAG: hypothetical protein K6F50_09210 [Kiritimatiellae bacterium]|nr:hypothetical protein [Kiritimatiellia bacterium]
MTVLPLLVAAVSVLPSDRLAMADRRFDSGDYETAKAEYAALRGEKGIAEDEILYRLAEAAYATGDEKQAHRLYGETLAANPASRHSFRARLMRALTGTEEERRRELPQLEGDDAPKAVRTAALYHMGVLLSDPERLKRCESLDPKGPYAVPALFRRATILSESGDQADRRKAVTEFTELAFLPDKTRAGEALYMAVRCCYADGKYNEASTLASRYMKMNPDGPYAQAIRVMAAWSYYREGKWSVAQSYCANGGMDDLEYLRGACALASGDDEGARRFFGEYLEAYPQGRYRESAELHLARLDYASAAARKDGSALVEAARRSASLSGAPGDRLRYAWALENAGRMEEAYAEYSAVAVKFSDTVDGAEARFRQALIDARAGRWSETDRVLSAMPEGDAGERRRSEALYWRGVAARQLKNHDAGVRFFEKALKGDLPFEEAREARLAMADVDYMRGTNALARAGEATARPYLAKAAKAYAGLVSDGACDRMSATRLRDVSILVLDERWGDVRPAESAACAAALVDRAESPAWRQLGFILLGRAEEKAGNAEKAMDAYRMAEKEAASSGPVAELPGARLALGRMESAAGEYEKADATLSAAVRELAGDHAMRAEAYLSLANNALADGRYADARKYATIVATLFGERGPTAESVKAAKALLESLPKEVK